MNSTKRGNAHEPETALELAEIIGDAGEDPDILAALDTLLTASITASSVFRAINQEGGDNA